MKVDVIEHNSQDRKM